MKNSVLIFLLFICVGMTACSSSKVKERQQTHQGSSILKAFDDEDLQRMQEFVDRFNDKKGDYILAIPPIIDGGYSIYDLNSDGSTVTIRIDSTRDIYSGNKYTYSCGSMKIEKAALVLNKCEGVEEGFSELKLFTFNRN
jgi:hypothetical protein